MKQVRNLRSELFAIAREQGYSADGRFNNWAKSIESVDTSKTNGYSLVGEFVPSGTVEVEITPRVYLTATAQGTRANHVTTYLVIRMDADGTLSATDIVTNDNTRGWALRIRDQVAALIEELSGAEAASPLASLTDEALVTELQRRGYTILKADY